MAIQGGSEFETISVYDPVTGGYREVSIEDYKKMLESLGFSDVEIKEKLREGLKDKIKALKDLGLSENEIEKLLKL